MKVLLIVPNYRLAKDAEHMYYSYAPYNLCLLGAMIENICEVKIIDAYVNNYTHEELKEILIKEKPNVVGLTTLMDQMKKHGHAIAKIVKEYDSKIKVLYGGVYVTMNPDVAIQDDNVDYFFLGEGEHTLPGLIKYLKGETKDLPKKGIMYKDKKTGKIINLGKAEYIKDLDSLPPPAYHLVDFTKYSTKVTRRNSVDSPRNFPYARLYTSRGCPYDCSFCQVGEISGRKFRFQSVKKVLEEMKILKEKFGVKSFIISDDNFFMHRRRVVELLNGMIENDLVMPWLSEDTGVMHLDKELLDLCKKSGCEYIGCAIETGNDRIMKDIIKGKKFTKPHVMEMVRYAQSIGLFVAANFIIGFPTETWDEITETLHFADKLSADYTRIFNLIPLKNTPLWEMCEKEDAFRDGYDHFNMSHSWNGGMIKAPAYTSNDLMVLRTFEWDRINFAQDKKRKKIAKRLEMSDEELLSMRKQTRDNMYKRLKIPGLNGSNGISNFQKITKKVTIKSAENKSII